MATSSNAMWNECGICGLCAKKKRETKKTTEQAEISRRQVKRKETTTTTKKVVQTFEPLERPSQSLILTWKRVRWTSSTRKRPKTKKQKKLRKINKTNFPYRSLTRTTNEPSTVQIDRDSASDTTIQQLLGNVWHGRCLFRSSFVQKH